MQRLAIFTNITASRTLLIPVQLAMVKVLGLGFPCHSKKKLNSNDIVICQLHVTQKDVIIIFMYVQKSLWNSTLCPVAVTCLSYVNEVYVQYRIFSKSLI